jgi:hypothetical protein
MFIKSIEVYAAWAPVMEFIGGILEATWADSRTGDLVQKLL